MEKKKKMWMETFMDYLKESKGSSGSPACHANRGIQCVWHSWVHEWQGECSGILMLFKSWWWANGILGENMAQKPEGRKIHTEERKEFSECSY